MLVAVDDAKLADGWETDVVVVGGGRVRGVVHLVVLGGGHGSKRERRRERTKREGRKSEKGGGPSRLVSPDGGQICGTILRPEAED